MLADADPHHPALHPGERAFGILRQIATADHEDENERPKRGAAWHQATPIRFLSINAAWPGAVPPGRSRSGAGGAAEARFGAAHRLGVELKEASRPRLAGERIRVFRPDRRDEERCEPWPAEGAFRRLGDRSEEHTSELQSLMRISY